MPLVPQTITAVPQLSTLTLDTVASGLGGGKSKQLHMALWGFSCHALVQRASEYAGFQVVEKVIVEWNQGALWGHPLKG